MAGTTRATINRLCAERSWRGWLAVSRGHIKVLDRALFFAPSRSLTTQRAPRHTPEATRGTDAVGQGTDDGQRWEQGRCIRG